MKILSGPDLVQILFDNGIACDNGYSIADRSYACPTLNWLKMVFAEALETFQSEFSQERWDQDINDCDDFARAAAFYAQWLHHNTKAPKAAALAFGELWFQQKTGGWHAINCAVVEDNKLVFFEPQNQTVIQLTDDERLSCALVRF